MLSATKRKTFNSPSDAELMENVIKAACQHFEISEDDFITAKRVSTIVNLRRICIYLIMKNTDLRDYAVAERFRISRTQVNHGNDIIDLRKGIYGQTSVTMKTIAAIANNFGKKYEWVIQ